MVEIRLVKAQDGGTLIRLGRIEFEKVHVNLLW